MAKFYIKIASVILLFAGSVIAGFYIMPESALSWLKDTDQTQVISFDGEKAVDIISNEADDTSNQEKQTPAEQDDEPVEIDDPNPEEHDEDPSAASSQPMIESVEFPPFDYWNIPKNGHTKIGYKVTIKAKTESGDNLKYEIRTSSGKQYTSTNGVFADVYPTDDGKFTVVVTNVRTGEQAQCEKSGLVKNPKLTASQIEKQLTEGINNRMFYFYFATNLQFKCYGSAITEDNIPKNLNALIEIAGMGFTVDVKDSTIKYNEWNRITYFEIELN